ncbi:hypothetical protein PDE_04552 [Penicillium oxalicum 114-2]|uniref:ARS binding protein Abp2 n=1 Tax=Penicillium oxalicum (strain 114-2 / CGMCC 5302) TaxID=933388 RepID=S8B4U4_PENO1|nr:hypothetical protein PDE_04552 [Penicillium oxalicum 114-2]
MEASFPAMIDSAERSHQRSIGNSQVVVQQYARYPSGLESTIQSASSLESARGQADTHRSPPLHRKDTPRSIQPSPRGVRSVLPTSSTGRTGPSMSPPLFDVFRQSPMKDTTDQVESRCLPSREVSDENIDDAYVTFILYCNPNVPSSVDTSELRKTFRSPPRSDGKSFSVFNLFQLIQKLDNKELKTWIQLAIELGVEPPSQEKKQSTQKVQQYAVRLKRWMRAMHVDAFFEFCLGHPHPYYTHLPSTGPFVSESRDGVPLEEDLALRALVPQWKPKRGRKRADEREQDEGKLVKRPQLDTSAAGLQPRSFPPQSMPFPQSAIPFSAYPTDEDPWMTASSTFPQHTSTDQAGQDLGWRLPERENSPAGYPQSAIIPRGNQSSEAFIPAEPRSAITPVSGEKARARRRHGPAVSSAWPSSNGSATGKGRGRPPSKASTSGSFSTFQVTASRDTSQTPQPYLSQTPASLASQDRPKDGTNAALHQKAPCTPIPPVRPGKLQLQVPHHQGAPVRLATPPTLLVNGVNGSVTSQSQGSFHAQKTQSLGDADRMNEPKVSENRQLDQELSTEFLVQALSEELAQATVVSTDTGRPARAVTPREGRVLASALVVNGKNLYSGVLGSGTSRFLAFQLGLGQRIGLPGGCRRLITATADRAPTHANIHNRPECGPSSERTQYSVQFEYDSSSRMILEVTLSNSETGVVPARFSNRDESPSRGALEIGFSDELEGVNPEDHELDLAVSDASWKQRYMRLRAQMQRKEKSLSQYKRKIVESVMADI